MHRKSGLVVRVLLSTTALFAVMVPSAYAQTFGVVKNFNGSALGANPENGLTAGLNGMLYGTGSSGGASNLGVVFRLSGKSNVTVLHSFAGGSSDGATPNGALIQDAGGALYGTTTAGGASGQGTVFRLNGKTETVLYSFAGGTADGAVPQAGLAMDKSGNLYGTTNQGGPTGNGTVFELIAPPGKNGEWKEKVLHKFGANKTTDGAAPIGGVTLDAAGNLYGTTSSGGSYGYGTVFSLLAGSKWMEHILHNFQNATDGTNPYAGLVADAAGNLYGAATDGGSNGGGTVFELKPSGSDWKFSVLTSLPGWGISGTFRDLVLDGSGNIYGTTHCDGANSAGTVYELSPSGSKWNYSLLYTFTGGSDGLYSISNLVIENGSLYGTTIDGGADGDGVIYEVTP
jgi:uncharacterized repeat protein (TIGR03803 family)